MVIEVHADQKQERLLFIKKNYYLLFESNLHFINQ